MQNANIQTNDRRAGALLGLAIGDALGAAVEFQPIGSFEKVTGYRAGGPHGLDPGQWTDDTSMALALADSIVTVGWDLDDQLNRYIAWWLEGKYSVNDRCFDIGFTVRSSLATYRSSGDANTCASRADQASGNGSIMRLAPVPIHYLDLFPGEIGKLSALAAESSLTTHGSEKCLSACRYMTLVLCGLMQGIDRDEVLSPTWKPLQELRRIAPLAPAVAEVAEGSYRGKDGQVDIVGSGYVVKSLEAALWAFHDASDFRQAVLKAVNLGDDADTTGAVCGQLAGAYWGRAGIPLEWLNGLARRETIENCLERLLAAGEK